MNNIKKITKSGRPIRCRFGGDSTFKGHCRGKKNSREQSPYRRLSWSWDKGMKGKGGRGGKGVRYLFFRKCDTCF